MDAFLATHTDQHALMLTNYALLNAVDIPSKRRQFPYDINWAALRPTYKTVELEYIKGREFLSNVHGGGDPTITVFTF